MLRSLAISGYRSIRDLVIPLAPLTVITGPNGAGKSNLYRALRILHEAARGEAIESQRAIAVRIPIIAEIVASPLSRDETSPFAALPPPGEPHPFR